MTLREHCSPEQLLAHAILDMVRDGGTTTQKEIRWALRILGEPAA